MQGVDILRAIARCDDRLETSRNERAELADHRAKSGTRATLAYQSQALNTV